MKDISLIFKKFMEAKERWECLPMPGYGIVGYACWSAACAASPLGIPVAAMRKSNL